MIGIVGGVGPLAGIDLCKKIIEETTAKKDQEHLPVILSSQPHLIADRIAFLLGKKNENPGLALLKLILELESLGVQLAAIPCNTAHASAIYNSITNGLKENGSKIKLLHLIEETAQFIQSNYPNKKVAVLSTTVTRDIALYKNTLMRYKIDNIAPDDFLQSKIEQSIFSEEYGIKAFSSPVNNKVKEDLIQVISDLKNQGAELIILACTELPLALTETSYFGLPIIDTNRVLARALIQQVAPEKLKPLLIQ